MLGFPRYRLARRLAFLFLWSIFVLCVSYWQGFLHKPRHAKTPDLPTVTLAIPPKSYPEKVSESRHDPPPPLPFVESPADTVIAAAEPHNYRPDGLLEVNPHGAHPILDLIERSESQWNDKLSRASKSLDEAVAEYHRRYNRAPPLGFDSWWLYAEEHNVQLPDEYDQIHRDLEHFWGMHPKDLATAQRDWEAHRDTYTIGKTRSSAIELVNYSLPEGDETQEYLLDAGYDIIELLEGVQHLIPPFRAVFSPHDNPNLLTDDELKSTMLKASRTRRYIDTKKPPPVKLDGWISACSPTSLARQHPIDITKPAPPPTNKTFIYDHRASMDPCLHPNLLVLHGQFLSHNKGPVPHRLMIPQFSYSPTLLHHDISSPTYINWMEDIDPRSFDPDWDDKIDERLLWRGSNTGMFYADDTRWRDAQRSRLVQWASELNGTAKILPPTVARNESIGDGVEYRKARVNPAMLDIFFAGEPLSCSPELCKQLPDVFEWRRRQSFQDAGNYKYVLDVDGNGWSSRFKRLITSNALIFKSTIYPEWYLDRIAPWVHYIPVQVDFSDLYDILMFFRGDLHGNGAHDDLAKKIATAGRTWSQAFWREEDMTAYLFR